MRQSESGAAASIRGEADPPSGTDLSAWHELMLRLAGRLPDDLISAARAWLADGGAADAAQSITFALAVDQMPVRRGDADLIAAELRGAGEDTTLVDALERSDDPDDWLAHWRFVPAPPWEPEPADQPIDLTQEPDLADPTELELARACSVEPRLTSLWRSWRLPPEESGTPDPRRVFVARAEEATDGGELVAITARLQEQLDTLGERDPQVEVLAAGRTEPDYAARAVRRAALVWAREPVPTIELARVFDLVDPVLGPRFEVGHPVLTDPVETARLLRRLRAGVPLLTTGTTMPDVLDPDRPALVPLTFRTDGEWIWTDTITYYLEQHALAPEPGLLAHLSSSAPHPAQPSDVALHRVLSFLYRSQDTEPVWSVPAGSAGPPPVDR